MERPSPKELFNKIKQAKEAVSNNKVLIIAPEVIASDAIELDYQVGEIQKVLQSLLDEIRPNQYAGSRPPQQSYKSRTWGLELFAFRWMSKKLGCETYIKFCLKERFIYLISLHQHRERKGD